MARINPGAMMVDGGGGYEPLIAVAVQAAVASPAVVDTPANVAPSAPAVEKVVTAVLKAVAPDDSDNRLRQIAKQATQAVVTNPAVIAAPAGKTVDTTTTQGIIAASIKMPYDSTKPATTVTMPFDGTTTPGIKNLDTTTLAGITAASGQPVPGTGGVVGGSSNAGAYASSGFPGADKNPVTAATKSNVTTTFTPTGDTFTDTLNKLRAERGITPADVNASNQLDVKGLTDKRVDAAQAVAAKPIMSAEQKAGGGVVKWIGGVDGKYEIVMPIGSPLVGSKAAGWEPGRNNLAGQPASTATTSTATSSTGSTANTTQKLPEGFTAGKFPIELEKYFGVNPSDIIGYKITPYTNAAGQTYYKLSISQKGAYGNAVSGSSEFGAPISKDPSGNWTVFQGDYSTGSNINGNANSSSSTSTTATTTTPTVLTGVNAETTALIKSLQDQIAALTKQVTNTSTTTALEEKQRKENALASLTSRFSKYGLESLIPKIKELVINGSTESTIALELAETEEYKQRFKANTERLKKGLSVLDPGTYIGMEDSYRQALRAYGLKQFDTDEYVSQFISNDVSANELSNRIVTAVQRIQNADPAITKQLKDFYNIGQNDLVAYVLDPNQQFQKIERQVQAAEIGVAAARQGITAGVQVAEQLAAQGVTQAEAQKGYATIADILPDAKKLSDIYGTTLEGYDLGQAEQEVFNQLASAQRRRQKLTQREIAAFGGSSGTNKTSLTTSSVGQF